MTHCLLKSPQSGSSSEKISPAWPGFQFSRGLIPTGNVRSRSLSVYWRHFNPRLLKNKRVSLSAAALKRLTIPRLELTAALLLAKLTKHVQATLKLDIKRTHLWTDSQVTLTWIKTHASRWKDYIRNRGTQIQELTSTSQWRHVPGTSNPADCASRGLRGYPHL